MSGVAMSDQAVSSRSEYFTTEAYDDAVEIMDIKPAEAAKVFVSIVQEAVADTDEAAKKSKMKEEAIYHLGHIYAKTGEIAKVSQLMVDIRPFFKEISKPRSAKIVRTLIDDIAKTPGTEEFLAQLCLDSIAWCVEEKRSFLRQRLEARLAALYCTMKKYKESLAVIRKLVREVKKFDDKPLMVEAELVESDVYFMLQNIPKSKGALTTARSNANGFYCPPLVQAQIDQQAGIIAAAEKDFKTAFSYFYEAYEGFSTGGRDAQAVQALKYMLLSKIMSNQASDVYNIVHSKAGVRYAGVEIEAMRAVANAYKQRSIRVFEQVLAEHKAQLQDDAIVATHLTALFDSLLEQNLKRLLEPFVRVQIAHVAELIRLPRADVEAKLSQMILDQKLRGILDQGSGDLILFDEAAKDDSYDTAIKVVGALDSVVDRLYAKTHKLASS
jgi:26S proteasome regulatory subunit N6